jgi:hypothetical protein
MTDFGFAFGSCKSSAIGKHRGKGRNGSNHTGLTAQVYLVQKKCGDRLFDTSFQRWREPRVNHGRKWMRQKYLVAH